jgi:hypothetical protein
LTARRVGTFGWAGHRADLAWARTAKVGMPTGGVGGKCPSGEHAGRLRPEIKSSAMQPNANTDYCVGLISRGHVTRRESYKSFEIFYLPHLPIFKIRANNHGC